MSFKSIVRDMRNGIGSISRRSFEVKLSHIHRTKSQSAVYEEQIHASPVQQSCWANLPPELLHDVIQRLEASEGTWPARKHVVACAAVCRSWRDISKEIVQTPEKCGKLTFPISLKQPGPREAPIQCFIKRDRAKSTYHLYMGLSPALPVDNGKFLLAAKKVRRTTGTEYIISLDAEEISRTSSTYVGKLRSNFLGTKFEIYDSQPPYSGAMPTSGRTSRRFYSKKVSPRVPSGNYNIAHIAYELNVFGTRGPRRMQCTIHSIPASAIEDGGSAPTPSELTRSLEGSFSSSFSKSMEQLVEFSSSSLTEVPVGSQSKGGPLILKNKSPRWHEQLQCWCLNFRGRVTVASVKNFQLVAAKEPSQPVTQGDPDKVILQFGKIGKDIFTMDYCYPLSVFQAFAICLSSFDAKLACE